MKYSDGSEARLGDRVRIENGDTGVIVVSIDTDEFSTDYPKREWGYLESGILVRTDTGALVRFADPLSPDLVVPIRT